MYSSGKYGHDAVISRVSVMVLGTPLVEGVVEAAEYWPDNCESRIYITAAKANVVLPNGRGVF